MGIDAADPPERRIESRNSRYPRGLAAVGEPRMYTKLDVE